MNSVSSNSSNGKANATPSIPSNSRKMVQSLKEIVNCPEHEIYAMLKECNMDPNDAVQRLLSQDPFHEVKSKRDKKKEMKESTEFKSRGTSNSSSRGGKGAIDRSAGRGSSTQFISSEYGGLRGRVTPKKENGSTTAPNSSGSISSMGGNNINQVSMSTSDSVSTENAVVGWHEAPPLSSQPSPGLPAWLGAPGQVSMADIVRSGRRHAKGHTVKQPIISAALHAQDLSAKVSDINHEPGIAMRPPYISGDEWSVVDQSSSATLSSVSEPSSTSVVYADPSPSSSFHIDTENLHLSSQLDELPVKEGSVSFETLGHDCTVSALGSDMQIAEENSGVHSARFDDTFRNNSYPSQGLGFEDEEDYGVPSSVEDVSVAISSTAANLQKLSLCKEEQGELPSEENPAVIIPNHIQVTTADCSHLSFGSFGSGISAAFSASFASKIQNNDFEEASVGVDVSSIEQPDTRNTEYYNNEQLRSASNDTVDPRTGSGVGSYDSSSSPKPEVTNNETAEATQDHHYPFPSSVPNYPFENATQANTATYSYAQTNSQMQNLAPFSSVMQAYASSSPSNFLASTVQPARESDLPYSPFLSTQSLPTKYSSAMPSVSASTISPPEAGNSSVFSPPQPAPQALPSTSIPTGPALPQHVPVHPYSQPTALPLGPFGSVFNYPYLPQSFTYMPSAFQQGYAGNSGYHQSPASAHSTGIKYSLPQYKNSISVSSLPHSASIPAGYGGFGGSANIPGGFTLNPSTSTGSTTISYDDILSSQYKDSNHYLPVQQNESSAMWVHGLGSRTMSALPSSTYYNFQGQNQHSGFRQSQQPSHYSALGYQNFYHSQSGVSQAGTGHQQSPSDGTLSGTQGPTPSQQSHQLWANSY